MKSPPIAVVTARELSRGPARVLERVARGERVIVARHGRPIATLQCLTGTFFEPGAEEAALDDLTQAQQDILHAGVVLVDRLVLREAGRIDDLQDLIIKGYAKKTRRGTVLTGRGHILRERLLARVG
jgi:antitoxin (DNA-binding transcriptional repressor) of toxin-antitoxin stability system